MFVLWLLEKLTHEENLPLTTFGRFNVMKGDVAVINNLEGGIELGQVTDYELNNKLLPTVQIRMYRRPK